MWLSILIIFVIPHDISTQDPAVRTSKCNFELFCILKKAANDKFHVMNEKLIQRVLLRSWWCPFWRDTTRNWRLLRYFFCWGKESISSFTDKCNENFSFQQPYFIYRLPLLASHLFNKDFIFLPERSRQRYNLRPICQSYRSGKWGVFIARVRNVRGDKNEEPSKCEMMYP